MKRRWWYQPGLLFLQQFKVLRREKPKLCHSEPRPQLSASQTLCTVNSTVLGTPPPPPTPAPPAPGRCQPPCPAKGAGSGTQKGPQRPANTVTILNIPDQCGHSFNLGVVREGCQCNSCCCNAESQGFKGLLSKLCPKSNSRVELLIEGMWSYRLTWGASTSAGPV